MKKCIFSFVPAQMRPLLAECRNRDLCVSLLREDNLAFFFQKFIVFPRQFDEKNSRYATIFVAYFDKFASKNSSKCCIFFFVLAQVRPLLAGCRNRDLRRHVCQPLTRGHFGLVHAEDVQRAVHEAQWHRIQKGNDHFREDGLSIPFHGVAWSRCSPACPPFGLICEKFGSCQCPRRRTHCRTLQVFFFLIAVLTYSLHIRQFWQMNPIFSGIFMAESIDCLFNFTSKFVHLLQIFYVLYLTLLSFWY